MTELETLGARRLEVDALLEDLREEKKALNQRIKAIRSDDLDMPHEDRVANRGHRVYVGGTDPERWYGIGRRQYHFLVAQGLRPSHKFVDVACGSLRLGQFLIPYLETGNYFGLEGSETLVKAGLEQELLYGLGSSKAPAFSIGYDFDISALDSFDYAIAQSLFTHLTPEDIAKCFTHLASKAHKDTRFYCTYFEGDESQNPDEPSHANKRWEYSFERLQEIAQPSLWTLELIGDWQHEADQQMVLARPV